MKMKKILKDIELPKLADNLAECLDQYVECDNDRHTLCKECAQQGCCAFINIRTLFQNLKNEGYYN